MSSKIEWKDITKVICDHLGLKEDQINENTNIYDDIGIDSLGLMTLGMKLQKACKVKIPLSVVSGINTLGDMLELLNKYAVKNG